jgi:hypothetical protein
VFVRYLCFLMFWVVSLRPCLSPLHLQWFPFRCPRCSTFAFCAFAFSHYFRVHTLLRRRLYSNHVVAFAVQGRGSTRVLVRKVHAQFQRLRAMRASHVEWLTLYTPAAQPRTVWQYGTRLWHQRVPCECDVHLPMTYAEKQKSFVFLERCRVLK